MGSKAQWVYLLAGGLLFFLGIRNLYRQGDWVLLILSVLIIAFTVSGILKKKSGDGSGS